MPTSLPVQLAIELQAADQRVTGRLTDEHGGRHPFGNWLDLLSLLEAARLRSLSPKGAQTQPPSVCSTQPPRQARRRP